ncbi:MAG: ATP-dependent RNA helicase HrpA [Pirellulaceae bacterium]|nr:ATP-dependent RNA helicase HrpA [Pirellulaceae bacterium]
MTSPRSNASTRSIERRQAREAIRLHFEYDAELPITAHRQSLIQLIRDRQVIVVCGETGSGKSTQLPKLCLEAGFGRAAMIGHTQPRRLAARSIAARLKEELSQSSAQDSVVGFKIRFTDATTPTTLVKLMTDGVLLAELSRDRFLNAYEVLIIDEAHERSLNIDLILAYLHRLLPKRPDLRLIITSATIDAEKFASHFSDALGPAPIVTIAGRTYDVDIRYLGAAGTDFVASESRSPSAPAASTGSSQDDRFLHAVDQLLSEMRGDILCFFPSEREIRWTHKLLRGHLTSKGMGNRIDVLPLYSRLTEAEQQRVFTPHKERRIVLATNVAESSLTVPGIYSVIDTGTARISRYAPRSKVQRLPIEAISQASANQRAGRCGRLAPGVCIRLYDESDFLARPAYTTPEIRRTDLAGAILQIELLNIGSIEDLPLLDPPRPEMIRDGIATLHEIGAFDEQNRVTEIGRKFGRWPVGPRIGRMLIEADKNGCLADVLIIAAALEAQDVRLRPPEKQNEADAAHENFLDPQSDFISFLKLWDFYHRLKEELGRSRLERACRDNYLSLPRFREWSEMHRQLLQLTHEVGLKANARRLTAPSLGNDRQLEKSLSQKSQDKNHFARTKVKSEFSSEYIAVHQCLLAGLLSGIAMLDDTKKYKGVGGMELQLWPGSGLRGNRPRWIVASEIVETQQRYARVAATIDPDWISDMAGHLLKHHHESPHFSRKAGGAVIYERSTLFGLPVVPRHPVPLAPIDPGQARRILIDAGLIEQQLVSRAAFYRHNVQLLDEVHTWAAKTRRRDLVVDAFFLQQFYDSKLPADVVDRTSLEKADKQTNDFRLTWDELVASFDRSSADTSFPEKLVIGPTELPIEYRFTPGTEDDGITIRVPESAVGNLTDDSLGWLVPGLLEEKVANLIKTLPKRLRRNLVPAPAMAGKSMAELLELRSQRAPFWPSLCRVLGKLAGEKIETSDFELDRLDPHLKIRLEIVDETGKVKQATRELKPIASAQSIASNISYSISNESQPEWYRDQMSSFDVEKLPRSIVVASHGVRLERYVGLVDHGKFVRPELFDQASQAEFAMFGGLLRLFAIAEHRELKSHVSHLPQLRDCELWLSDRLASAPLRAGLADQLAKLAFLNDSDSLLGSCGIWSREAFEIQRVDRNRRLSTAAADVGKWLPKFAQSYHALRMALQSSAGPANREPPALAAGSFVKPSSMRTPEASAYGSQSKSLSTGQGMASSWKLSIEDIHQQLDELFRPGFLIYTPWSWLKEFPRYLQAIHHRLTRLKTAGLPQDALNMEKISLYTQDLHRRIQKDCFNVCRFRIHEAEDSIWPIKKLSEYRWMIEEYRVSLYAQQLGTRCSISSKKLDKIRDECDMP